MGKFLIWIGNSLLKLEDYEQISVLESQVNNRMRNIEQEFPELNEI